MNALRSLVKAIELDPKNEAALTYRLKVKEAMQKEKEQKTELTNKGSYIQRKEEPTNQYKMVHKK